MIRSAKEIGGHLRGFSLGICLFLSVASYAQIDASAGAFFPHSVGNAWHYQDQPVKTITRDSIADGVRFLFFDTSTVPEFTIDSALNIVQYPTNPYRRMLRYKLNANLMEWWVVQERDTTIGRPALDARVDSVFWGYLFGVVTQMKAIGYYKPQRINDSVYHYWHYEEYLAAGFGFFLSFTDPPWMPYVELVGCIIDRVRYGTLVSVPDEDMRTVPLSSRLYPCFPNPFNPTTTIYYDIPEEISVRLSIFDMLGREVAVLVNGESRRAGSYSVEWDASGVSSGVYAYRMQANGYTAVRKMLLTK